MPTTATISAMCWKRNSGWTNTKDFGLWLRLPPRLLLVMQGAPRWGTYCLSHVVVIPAKACLHYLVALLNLKKVIALRTFSTNSGKKLASRTSVDVSHAASFVDFTLVKSVALTIRTAQSVVTL